MKYINFGNTNEKVSQVVHGCMRIFELEQNQVDKLVKTNIENGINFFDHADIYCAGKCEELFGQTLKNESIKRDEIFIQSKASIVLGSNYDTSKEYLTNAVEGILKRLDVDYLDSFLIHRPDILMEADEVAETFMSLKKSGKVKYFGVSNFNPMQIELLKRYFPDDIVTNQLQLSPTFAGMISQGVEVNRTSEGGINRDGAVLDYMRLKGITPQIWSPFLVGQRMPTYINNPDFPELNETLQQLADKYGVTKSGIVTAWVLRHPANMQIISGSTKLHRMQEVVDGCEIVLSRKEWYAIYMSAGNILP